jgi:hypothetical protein
LGPEKTISYLNYEVKGEIINPGESLKLKNGNFTIYNTNTGEKVKAEDISDLEWKLGKGSEYPWNDSVSDKDVILSNQNNFEIEYSILHGKWG